jgi:uncharacterized MAPEG superfamily protein
MSFQVYAALSAVLLWVMILGASMLRNRGWTVPGMMAMFGNRENAEAPHGLAGRADRAASNMIENMVVFAVAAIAAIAAGKTEAAAFGAALFFWARLVYWPVYLAGIPYLRTALWLVSIIGIGKIALTAFG